MTPLFEPLNQALLGKLRSEAHWHADETRWAVFVTMQGKVGHRWYLWEYIARYHYLGYTPMSGSQMRYNVFAGDSSAGRLV